MQQQKNCWKWCFLRSQCRGYMRSQSEIVSCFILDAAAERCQLARRGAIGHRNWGHYIVGSCYQATWLKTQVCVWQWSVKGGHDLYEHAINPVINPKPIYSHPNAWQYYVKSTNYDASHYVISSICSYIFLIFFLAFSSTTPPTYSSLIQPYKADAFKIGYRII
jgi:hypothetical protein